MTARRIIAVAVSLPLFCLPAFSQDWFVPKTLSFFDSIMSKGRIARSSSVSFESTDRTSLDLSGVSLEFGTAPSDPEFVQYLLESDLKGDALALMCSDLFAPSDTLSYLRGWTFYNTKYLGEACRQFSQVGAESQYYDKSFFYGAVTKAFLGDYSGSLEQLDSYSGTMYDLLSLQRSGIELLKGNYFSSRAALACVGDSHYAVVEAREALRNELNFFEIPRLKSPALAGIASAIVPGLGKIYAGRTGEGVMSFLTVGAFAAVTSENWVKSGISDWRTIVFGTLGTLFYISNIYGSCVAVKVYNDNLLESHETAVLLDIHIPLYSIFD